MGWDAGSDLGEWTSRIGAVTTLRRFGFTAFTLDLLTLFLVFEQWADRKAGLCGLYAGQVMPIGDAKCVEMTELFEREMYARYQQVLGESISSEA